MTDPLDSLRRPPSSTQPHPAFRASLMREVEQALTTAESTGHPVDQRGAITTATVEVSNDEPSSPRRVRTMVLGALAAAAAAATVVGLAWANGEHTAPEPADTAPDAARPTTIPLTITTTTTAPPLTDAQIATVGLLSSTEVGDGYLAEVGTAFHLQAGGAAASSPACAPFIDTVFESPSRPATVQVRPFGKAGAAMQQYIVVFPDRSAADAMMRSLADPAFPACWSAVVTEAYTGLDQSAGITDRTPQLPAEPRPLAVVGDDMVVLSTTGSFTYAGTVYTDEGLVPFVQVGRAITWMNPSSAPAIGGGAGYPDAQLEQALAAAVAHLRVAQLG